VVTARQIADQFGVSLRTVYRDIKVLEESGIPVTGEAGLGYSLVDGFKLPPLMFTTEEAIAFLMAEKLVSNQADGDTYQLYRSGMDKIRAVLKAAEKNILEDFDDCIHVMEDYSVPRSEPANILQSLLHCIIEKKEAKMEYFANYNWEITTRDIEPVGFFFMINNWYLMAWCRLRNDYRTFSLSRIRKLVSGEKKFLKNHPDLKTILALVHPNGIVYKIRLKVQKSALKNQGMTKHIFGLVKEEEQKKHIIQDYQVHSLEQFARWYLSFADQADILEPAEFKEIVLDLLDRIKNKDYFKI